MKGSLANLAKHSIDQLIVLAKTRLQRIQDRPALIEGFLATAGPDPTPFVTSTIKDR